MPDSQNETQTETGVNDPSDPATQEVQSGGESPTASPPAREPSFKELFEASLATEEFREGDLVKGKVIQIGNDFALVDIGYKSEGQVPLREFTNAEGKVELKEGDVVEVLLESMEDEEGLVVLSKEKGDKLRVWEDISAACERDELVEGTIVSRVKGGLCVDIGVKAFLPGSQVDLRPIRNLDTLIGQRFHFKVIKFNKKRGNIVLSRRVLLEEERATLKEETLAKLEEGAVVDGIVKNLTEYGAFIDLGGIDGLLHVTDMSWGRVGHPSELFHVGDEIQVKVLKFDPESERVSLGYKQITEDPWSNAEEKYPLGYRVQGKVVSLAEYGAFVELEPGLEGLVHVSEMSWTQRVKHPSKLVNVGDEVEAIVLDIDSVNKRISLGMKQVEPNPWTQLEEKYPVGSTITGRVRNITDFGIFIGIEEGIDGLVHISDLSWLKRVDHPSELHKKGDEVTAKVLNIDVENERFSLGTKQLTDDPWFEIPRKYPVGTMVDGKVVKVTDFGVFMEIEQDLEGLIHVSELSEDRVEDPRAVLSEGEELKAVVINVDPDERKIGLSVKALKRAEEESDYREYLSQQKTGSTPVGELIDESLIPKEVKGESEGGGEGESESGGEGESESESEGESGGEEKD